MKNFPVTQNANARQVFRLYRWLCLSTEANHIHCSLALFDPLCTFVSFVVVAFELHQPQDTEGI